jgi:ketosteroid isomerase-like protein
MDDVDAFLSAVMPQLEHEIDALHSGDVAPRMAMWSHHEPVSLFGAAMTKRGWDDVEPAFRWLATTFHGSESFEYEVVAAGVSGDLGYVAGIEHSIAAKAGSATPVPYRLRVTTVFRREDGEWKVVHRHGDPYDESTGDLMAGGSASAPQGAGPGGDQL